MHTTDMGYCIVNVAIVSVTLAPTIVIIMPTVSTPFKIYSCGLLLAPGSHHIIKFSVSICILPCQSFVIDLPCFVDSC